MLEIYAFATPNRVKVAIAAEEMGLPLSLVPVDLRQGEQRSDAFLLEMRKAPEGDAGTAARKEVERVLGVLQRDLYVAGDQYTIADITHFGWIWRHQAFGAHLAPFPSVKRWHDEILSRPAVAAAITSTLAR
jgi:glutathione S-transferase